MLLKPIIILGAPRSGTTILYRCLALHPELWHLPDESHHILEGPFHPARTGIDSNRVTASDMDDKLAFELKTQFYRAAINLNRVMRDPVPFFVGNSLPKRVFNKIAVQLVGSLSHRNKPKTLRFLEKTPKNTLRVSMLARLF